MLTAKRVEGDPVWGAAPPKAQQSPGHGLWHSILLLCFKIIKTHEELQECHMGSRATSTQLPPWVASHITRVFSQNQKMDWLLTLN